jgi:hypothetical protein
MAKDLSAKEQIKMWKELERIQEAFPFTLAGFLAFAGYVIKKLIKGSPKITWTQLDLCDFLFLGQRLRMIQANRGLGKTTLCAIYAVFRIIHDPTTRVLIFSAGGKLSKEIANWCIQIIEYLPILHILQPDQQNGDRASVEAYDVHWVFKGAEKSPSIKCLGVDSHSAGSRADVLIADDIESPKNARTVMMRELIVDLTKEFESICQDGDIIYLGTPHFYESIYNDLPSRGFEVRIWTARYPTKLQLENYGNLLAPKIIKKMEKHPEYMTGYGADLKQGKPTTPKMFPDKLLMEKELSQGKGKFQLQYMLNTRLADADRYPLKLCNFIVMPFNNDQGVVSPIWTNDDRYRIHKKLLSNQTTDKLYGPMPVEYETRPFERSLLYLDPAGGGKNGDETGYAIIRTLGSYVYIHKIGGVKGGYEPATMLELVNIAKRYEIKEVWFEQNYGNGALAAVLKPLFQIHHKAKFEDHWATGQKEVRITDTIEPLLSSHRLVIHPDAIDHDLSSVEQYPTRIQKTYSGLFQMSMMTIERDCLVHDDRADALASALIQVTLQIDFDNEEEMRRRRLKEQQAWLEQIRNPQNYRDDVPIQSVGKTLGSQFSARKW